MVLLSATVGNCLVAQHTPRACIVAPETLSVPPLVAAAMPGDVTGVVVNLMVCAHEESPKAKVIAESRRRVMRLSDSLRVV